MERLVSCGGALMPFVLRSNQSMDTKAAVVGKVPGEMAPSTRRSRFKRLLVRVSASERLSAVSGGGDEKRQEDGKAIAGEVEPSSVCLDKMVLSFMEESAVSNERPLRSRCNCFNGNNYDDSSDEEFDFLPSNSHGAAVAPSPSAAASGDAAELLKGLVQSESVIERNLLADASRILEKNKSCKGKADCRRVVHDGLKALGYDAAICKSRWEKTTSYPAGEYEYIDVLFDGEKRLLVEVDFRSEYEVARPTKAYRAALQTLPAVFVGTQERLAKIITIVTEAARQSLKKKGLSFPPWRKPEYMRAKWLSPGASSSRSVCSGKGLTVKDAAFGSVSVSALDFTGEFSLRRRGADQEQRITVTVSPWRPTESEAKRRSGTRLVTGLASVL